jgi:hypothetical protein
MVEPGRLTEILVVPATAGRWTDVVTVLGGNGDRTATMGG